MQRLLETALTDGLWVPLDCYLANYQDTKRAVYSRRSRGDWKDGVHSKIIKGGGLWINLLAVNEWAAQAKCESRKESTPDTEQNAAPSESSSCSAASHAASPSS